MDRVAQNLQYDRLAGMGRIEHFAVGLLVCALGCASATIGDSDADGVDGGPDPAVDGAPKLLPDASQQTTTLSQSTSPTIVEGNSVSCNSGPAPEVGPPFVHTDNHYYRVYDLTAQNITADFEVTSVNVGIETATGAVGAQQPASVFIYQLDGAFTLANLTVLGNATTTIADQTGVTVNVPVSALVPAGSTMVVEFFTPDGQTDGNSLFIGSNNLGETGPSYLRTPEPDCGAEEPTETGQLPTENPITMHILLDVTGNHF